MARKHLELSADWKGDRRGIVEMRRHYTNYFKGIHNFKEVRQVLVTSVELAELYDTLDSIVSRFEKGDFERR